MTETKSRYSIIPLFPFTFLLGIWFGYLLGTITPLPSKPRGMKEMLDTAFGEGNCEFNDAGKAVCTSLIVVHEDGHIDIEQK